MNPCHNHITLLSKIDQFLLEPDYVIDLDPMATPRPRTRIVKPKGCKPFATIYNDAAYTKYKKELSILLKSFRIPKDPDYSMICAIFYLPYPKSTPKKNLIEGAPHMKKPDWDNFVKGLQDALEQSGVIANDSHLATGLALKRYTTKPRGRIEFSLF